MLWKLKREKELLIIIKKLNLHLLNEIYILILILSVSKLIEIFSLLL